MSTTSFRIPHRAGGDAHLTYRITALIGLNVLSVSPLADECTDVLKVTLKADPEFRALTRKSVVPIAGSAPGAFGGRFKTSLKLVANGPDERGRIVFHPSGALMASCSKDRTVKLWNPAAPAPLKSLEGHTAWIEGIVFIEQGTKLATVSADQTVRIWDLTDPPKKK